MIPFPHIHQLLKENSVDVILDFQKQTEKKNSGIYKELTKVRTVCFLPEHYPLPPKTSLTLDDLKKEKVILFNPQIAPDCFNPIQRMILDQKPMTDIYMLDSPENCIALARAGFGIAVLPELFAPIESALPYLPLENFDSLSYGAYYNSTAENPVLKLFLRLCREYFIP